MSGGNEKTRSVIPAGPWGVAWKALAVGLSVLLVLCPARLGWLTCAAPALPAAPGTPTPGAGATIVKPYYVYQPLLRMSSEHSSLTPTHTATPTPSPTNSPTPTATFAPTPTSTLPSPQGVVLLDGPWASLPAGAGAGLVLDDEEGSLTLQSDMTAPAFVTVPDPDKPAFPNTVWELGVHQGRVYMSYGDFYNNQGPVDIVSYDPRSGALTQELLDAPEEQWGSWLVAEDGRLYVAGGDARESQTFGNIYLSDGLGWQKRRTIFKGLHVRSVVDFQGRLYASYGSDGSSPVAYTFVLGSDNGGAIWTYDTIDGGAVRDAGVDDLATVSHPSGAFLYATAYRSFADGGWDQGVYRYDGNTWAQVTITDPQGTFTPYDLFPFGERMLVWGQGPTGMTAYALDGQTQTEVTFLRGKSLSWSRCAVHDGWLYYLDGLRYDAPSGPTNLYRTRDLQTWETVGLVSLLPGARPASLAFCRGRLYVGATNSGGSEAGPGLYAATNSAGSEGAEYLSPAFALQGAIAGGRLFFEGTLPTGSSVRFQVRSAESAEELAQASFVGPDGTQSTYYQTSGASLWAGHDGDTYVQYRALLASSNPALAPLLRQVALVPQGGALGSFTIETGSPLPWRAGEARPITVTARFSDGRIMPIQGSVALSATDVTRGETVAVTPQEITLSDGTGTAEVALQRATDTQLCVNLAGVTSCSTPFTVQPGVAAAISVTSDLREPSRNWSPVGKVGQAFTLTLTILDRYHNVVTDYVGTVQCQCRQWAAASAQLPAPYTFQVGDQGVHQFPSGVSIPSAGEWNLACFDTSDPRIAGTQTVNIQS